MLYLHTRRNRQARNSTSWGEVACLQVAALEPTCQDGGQKIGRKASKVVISLKNLAIVNRKRKWFSYHRKCRHLYRHGRKHYNSVVYKILRRFWDHPKRERIFSNLVLFSNITQFHSHAQYNHLYHWIAVSFYFDWYKNYHLPLLPFSVIQYFRALHITEKCVKKTRPWAQFWK